MDREGILGIPWPITCGDDTPAEFDFILATATRSEPTPPTQQEVAHPWFQQSSGDERYLIENLRHGIRTSDDPVIWSYLKELAPSWMTIDLIDEIDAILAQASC